MKYLSVIIVKWNLRKWKFLVIFAKNVMELVMQDVFGKVASAIKNEILKNISSILDDIVTKVFENPGVGLHIVTEVFV